MGKSTYKSRVFTERPEYADLPSPEKFQAIQAIILTRLKQHPNAICSYSGGSDSDIMIDMIERARALIPGYLEPVKYVFFNTGLEMKATKDHVKGWQKKQIPLSIANEYARAENKAAKRQELKERYPKCQSVINFLCCCNSAGEPRPDIQLVINSSKFMLDFIRECPPDFQISAKCCDYCKKQLAHNVQKSYDMIITGECRDEGGMRSVPRSEQWNETNTMCFAETSDGKFRFRPLYYVSDKDKAWYKEYYGIKYSDAYEVYGLTRTGCCGCPISYKAVDEAKATNTV